MILVEYSTLDTKLSFVNLEKSSSNASPFSLSVLAEILFSNFNFLKPSLGKFWHFSYEKYNTLHKKLTKNTKKINKTIKKYVIIFMYTIVYTHLCSRSWSLIHMLILFLLSYLRVFDANRRWLHLKSCSASAHDRPAQADLNWTASFHCEFLCCQHVIKNCYL